MGRPAKPKSKPIQFMEKPEYVEVEKLRLDYSNIRILHAEKNTDKDVESLLWKEADLQLLYDDIKHRGLQDPLILHPKGYTVAEGNCRLVCMRRLNKESHGSKDHFLKQFKDYKVKCLRIDPNTPPRDIEAYLAEIHVGQKSEWPDYNQSELMHRLYTVRGLSLDEIARIVRKTKSTVLGKIDAYEATTQYHKVMPHDKKWHLKFPYMWEFLKQSDLNEFRQDDANVKRFMKWLADDRFTDSKDVRLLGKIINNKIALRQLELNNATEAIKTLIVNDPTVKSSTFKKIVTVTSIIEAFPTKELIKTVQEPARKELLVQLKNSVVLLLKQIAELEKSKDFKTETGKGVRTTRTEKLQLSSYKR